MPEDSAGHRLYTKRRFAVLAVAALILVVAAITPALASVSRSGSLPPHRPTSPSAIERTGPAPTGGQTRPGWQREIAKLPALRPGCYHASYPLLQWHAVPCQVAPSWPMNPASLPQVTAPAAPKDVGNGTDYSAKVTGTISEATGLFDGVSRDITETGQVNHKGPQIANTFTLQMNSQFFSTPACSKSSDPGKCEGWQQFIYETDSNTVYMQYWLLNYAAKCPSGWYTYAKDCYRNSPASTYAGGRLTAADLASAALGAEAVPGGNDQVSLSSGSGQATLVAKPDSVLDLARKWDTAEFGVYGDGGGGEAKFGADTTLEAQTTLDSSGTAAPACVKEGFTGETNNLALTGTPKIGAQGSPTIVSAQTNGSATAASCAAIGGPVKAALLDPWGGCGTYAPGWNDLNSDWSSYGTTPLTIDTTTFCDTSSSPVTYSALVADDPRVLVLSDPAGGLHQLTAGEIAAIGEYVKAGHNLVGTYMTFDWGTADNAALADLFGLAPGFSSETSAVTPDYYVKDPVWPMFRKVPSPYDSAGYPYSQVPSSGTWGSSALQGAKYVAETTNDVAAITCYDTDAYQATFISNMPEYTPGPVDLQFLYNVLTQAYK
jgi:hypothetical protein